MVCQELVEVANDYLEGTMREEDRRRLESHLGDCPGCAAYLEQIRQTVDLLGRAGEETLSSDEAQPLLEAFRRWKKEME